MELHLRLETPIDAAMAVGDPIRARLGRAVKVPGLVLEEGAVVEGRIRRLEEVFRPRGFFVGLEFFAVTRVNDHALFTARLIGPRRTAPRMVSGPGGFVTESAPVGLDIDESWPQPGVGVFRVPGSELRLKRGFRTVWQTVR